MSRPINQHWAPQFYLRGFSTAESRNKKNPQVWIFSKQEADGPERLTNIRNVCARRYLYSPINADGQRNWKIDEKLSDLENCLSGMWPGICETYVNLAEDSFRKAIALFVASMLHRHPDNIGKLAEIHTQIVQLFDSVPKRSDGSPNVGSILHKGKEYPIDTAGWARYKSWGASEHHKFFNDWLSSETGPTAMELLKKRWSVVFSEREEFITSDKPAAVVDRTGRHCGINSPGAIISFPLSPKRILVMDDMHSEPANQYYPLRKENVGAFNFVIWNSTSRFFITGRSVEDVLREMLSCAGNGKYA